MFAENDRKGAENVRPDRANGGTEKGNPTPGYSLHGGDVYRHSVQYDFSVNVNPLGMPPQVIEHLRDTVGSWHHYPDPYCQELRAALSGYCNVPEEQIVCGNGAADLLDRLIRVWRPEQALIPVPTFTEYERLLSQEGCGLHFFYLKEEENFVPQVDELIRALEQMRSGRQKKWEGQHRIGEIEGWKEQLRPVGRGELDQKTEMKEKREVQHRLGDSEEQGRMMVILCNPNNPTGQAIPAKEVIRLAKACRRTRSLLVLDECFCEFLEKEDEYSFMEQIESYPEVVILRAFTKFYAMAGLRLGYAVCGDRKLAKSLQERGQPWSVSIPAQEGGIAALKAAAEDLGEAGYRERTLSLLATEREFLRRELTALGFAVFPSQVNFLLFRDDQGEEDGDLWEACLRREILIRDCRDFRGLPGQKCGQIPRGNQDQENKKTFQNYQDQEKTATPGDKPEDKPGGSPEDKKGDRPGDERPSRWYRVCVGLPEANRHLIQVLKEICRERRQEKH